MTPNDTVKHLTRSGLALARGPVAVAAYAAGVVKGTVEGTVHVVGSVLHPQRGPHPVESDTARAGQQPPTDIDDVAADTSSAATGAATDTAAPRKGERIVFGGLNTEPAPPMMPGGGGEPIEHEPHAESRAAAHGEAAVDPREAESWEEEAAADGDEPDLAAEPVEDEPLLDPSVAKAVRSEAEILTKAADPDKG